jgi:hypothetical protein
MAHCAERHSRRGTKLQPLHCRSPGAGTGNVVRGTHPISVARAENVASNGKRKLVNHTLTAICSIKTMKAQILDTLYPLAVPVSIVTQTVDW